MKTNLLKKFSLILILSFSQLSFAEDVGGVSVEELESIYGTNVNDALRAYEESLRPQTATIGAHAPPPSSSCLSEMGAISAQLTRAKNWLSRRRPLENISVLHGHLAPISRMVTTARSLCRTSAASTTNFGLLSNVARRAHNIADGRLFESVKNQLRTTLQNNLLAAHYITISNR